MDQSTSTASGMAVRQKARASMPSQASAVSKSSASRMRRATLRTTRLSSTTRHIFMRDAPTGNGEGRPGSMSIAPLCAGRERSTL